MVDRSTAWPHYPPVKPLRARRPSPWLALSLLLAACDPLPGDTADTGSLTGTDSATSVATMGTGDGSGGETLDPSATSAGSGGDSCQPLPHAGDPCAADGDCEMSGDCCGCIAYNPSLGSPGNCGGGCGQTVCEDLGLVEAFCDAGSCRVRGLSCDQTAVACDAVPPECPAGELPQVAEQCFSGACLPVAYCDWVPDCSACPQGDTCVVTQTAGCDQTSCIPEIAECPPGPPTCDCLGSIACGPPYGTCAIDGEIIVCS